MKVVERKIDQVATWDECKEEIKKGLGLLDSRKNRAITELMQFEESLKSFLNSRSASSEALKRRMRSELLVGKNNQDQNQ